MVEKTTERIMLGSGNNLSRPSVVVNTIWESLIKEVGIKKFHYRITDIMFKV